MHKIDQVEMGPQPIASPVALDGRDGVPLVGAVAVAGDRGLDAALEQTKPREAAHVPVHRDHVVNHAEVVHERLALRLVCLSTRAITSEVLERSLGDAALHLDRFELLLLPSDRGHRNVAHVIPSGAEQHAHHQLLAHELVARVHRADIGHSLGRG